MKHRILIRYGGYIRDLARFTINKNDGSFYVSVLPMLKRQGETHTYRLLNDVVLDVDAPPGKNISYHTSGRINFENRPTGDIFAEPLTNITQNFFFGSIIVPHFTQLDIYNGALRDSDCVLPISGIFAPMTQIDLCISPFSSPITSYGFVKAHFSLPNMYTLNFIESDEIALPHGDMRSKFCIMTPQQGLFDKQQISKQRALIDYHQKRHGHRGPIVYGPNQDGVYTLIFPIPAIISPKILSNLSEIALSIDIIKTTTTSCCFRVRDKQGKIVMDAIPFSRVELADHRLIILV